MTSGALGMIEVYGMLGAVEAADAALKAASVSLLRAKRVRGGLVTVLVAGDVAAVQSAVDAAVASLNRLGRPCSSHVIPRLSSDVASMLAEDEGGEPAGAEEAIPQASANSPARSAPQGFDDAERPAAGREPETVESAPDRMGEPGPDRMGGAGPGRTGGEGEEPPGFPVAPEEEPEDEGEESDGEDESEGASWSGEPPELENLTVMELRRLARNAPLRTMSKKQIRFAGKAELIRELTAFYDKKRGERE